MSRLSLLAGFCVAAGCTFPSDGVLLQSEPPDAEVVVVPDGEPGAPDAELPDAEPPPPDACTAVEACNGMDDDCDGVADDGFVLDADCDGPGDDDLCAEGKTVCTGDGTGTECDDATDTIVEVCNEDDDDCDGMTDEDFDLDTDEQNCGTCGHACTNAHGTTACITTACVPTCANGAAQCNANLDDGCELQDTDPACGAVSATPDLTVTGDQAGTAMTTGTTERIVRVRITESLTNNGAPITARFALASGAGTDYDLVVYCTTCGTSGITDADDIIEVGRNDAEGDRSYDVFVEVRYDPTTPSTTCATWTLTVTGSAATANRCAG